MVASMSFPSYLKKSLDVILESMQSCDYSEVIKYIITGVHSFCGPDLPCNSNSDDFVFLYPHLDACPKCYLYATLRWLVNGTGISRTQKRQMTTALNNHSRQHHHSLFVDWKVPDSFIPFEKMPPFHSMSHETFFDNSMLLPPEIGSLEAPPSKKRARLVQASLQDDLTNPLLFNFAVRYAAVFKHVPSEIQALIGSYLFQGKTEKAKDAVANVSGFESRIGREIGRLKADVVHSICVSDAPISFSKYAGCLELQNAAILFLNIDGTSFCNEFSDGGSTLTWFASAATSTSAPIVRRLSEDPKLIIMVAARFLSGNFVYLGRAQVMATDLGVCPIKFTLRLLDLGKVLASTMGNDIVKHGTKSG